MTDAFLFDRPTRLEGPDGMADWIRMFVKRPFDGLEAALSDELIAAAVDELGADSELLRDGVWYADYVHLRMRAVKVA